MSSTDFKPLPNSRWRCTEPYSEFEGRDFLVVAVGTAEGDGSGGESWAGCEVVLLIERDAGPVHVWLLSEFNSHYPTTGWRRFTPLQADPSSRKET